MSRSQRTRMRRRSRSKPRSRFLLGSMVILAIVAVAGLSAVGYVASIAASAPPLDSLKARDPGGFSVVLDRDGNRLGVIQANDLRKAIPADQIPQSLKDATIAIEDSRFYEHEGVDYTGIVRAAFKNLEAGANVQGGSTITMQLVRTMYGDDADTFERKIREAKLAEELEDEHSKEWILTEYLNTVPFGTYGGQTALGVWAAAKTYFNTGPSNLTLAQSALLAGLPQAPSTYSPIRSGEAAIARRNQVLDAMAREGSISEAEAATAKAEGLGLNMSEYFQARKEDYFFDYVKDELLESFPKRVVKRGGLRVYTTIDIEKQEAARDAIAQRLAGVGPSSAVVTIDPDNGEILTMASSSDYSVSKFNLAAQGRRQPGSSFKTMALMAALRRGVDPDSTYYTSMPLDFVDPTYGPIETKTYDSTYDGSINLRSATVASDNSVYMQLALDLGPDNVAETAQDLGIQTKLDGYPAETLGGLTIGVSPLEMASAYATIAGGGVYNKPVAITKIKQYDGEVLQGDDLPKRLRPLRERRFEDGVTAKATEILEDNVTGGTGTAAQTGCPTAGKTGTTDENSDGWFVGFTTELSSAVWVGFPDSQVRMDTEYYGGPVVGGSFPAEIWGDYTQAVMGDSCESFPEPKNPMTFTPFYGEYATGGTSSSTYDYDTTDDYNTADPYYVPPVTATETVAPETTTAPVEPGTDTEPTAPDPGTDTGGADVYDPDLYESQPDG
ncbi:MAG: transglycosylase domain-containing protein [Solirubrobacteraceae bacterium]